MKNEVNKEGVAPNWQSRGFSCELWVDPPGQFWEGFVHNVDELILVIEGKLELTMEGTTRPCHVGDEILIPARTVHDVRNIGGTTARWLYGYKSR